MKLEEVKKIADENWEDILEIVDNNILCCGDIMLKVEKCPGNDLCYIMGIYVGEYSRYYGTTVFCWEGTTEDTLRILEDISDVEPTKRRKGRRIKRIYNELIKELKNYE